jgi:predicted transcriptional regulator
MAMTLRLSEEQDKQLAAIAESLGISKNKAAMEAIEAFIEREWQRAVVKSVVAEVLVRDKELFDLLADS